VVINLKSLNTKLLFFRSFGGHQLEVLEHEVVVLSELWWSVVSRSS
jgi:hypothetical protein